MNLKKQVKYIKDNLFFPSIQSLTGRVLEIGFGRGNNFKYYNKDCEVYGIDIKVRQTEYVTECKFYIKKGIIESLPFEDKYFDAVVGSFVLCSVQSVGGSVDEIRRVLKDGGKLILLEHVKSDRKIVIFFQKIVNLVSSLLMNKCRLDRTPQIFIKEKFCITKEEKFDNYLEPYVYIEAYTK